MKAINKLVKFVSIIMVLAGILIGIRPLSVYASDIWDNSEAIVVGQKYHAFLNVGEYKIYSVEIEKSNNYRILENDVDFDASGYVFELFSEDGIFLATSYSYSSAPASMYVYLEKGKKYYVVLVNHHGKDQGIFNFEMSLSGSNNLPSVLGCDVTFEKEPDYSWYQNGMDERGEIYHIYDTQNEDFASCGAKFTVRYPEGMTRVFQCDESGKLKDYSGNIIKPEWYESFFWKIVRPLERYRLYKITVPAGLTSKSGTNASYRFVHKQEVESFEYKPLDPEFAIKQSDTTNGKHVITPAILEVTYSDQITKKYTNVNSEGEFLLDKFVNIEDESDKVDLDYDYKADFSKVGKTNVSLTVKDKTEQVEFNVVERSDDDLVSVEFLIDDIVTDFPSYDILHRIQSSFVNLNTERKDGTKEVYRGTYYRGYVDQSGNEIPYNIEFYHKYTMDFQPGQNDFIVYVDGIACHFPVFYKQIDSYQLDLNKEVQLPENIIYDVQEQEKIAKLICGTLTFNYNDGEVKEYAGNGLRNFIDSNDNSLVASQSYKFYLRDFKYKPVNSECEMYLAINGCMIPITVKKIHNFETKDGVKPTCEEVGYTEYQYCSNCEYEENKEEIPETGHIDENEDQICDVCNEPYYFAIIQPKNCNITCGETVIFETGIMQGQEDDYTYQWYVQYKNNTEGALNGETTKTYSMKKVRSLDDRKYWCVITRKSDQMQQRTRAVSYSINHIKDEFVSGYEADCFSEGYMEYRCSSCGSQYRYDNPSSLGHTYSTESTQKKASCMESGYTGDEICVRCGHVRAIGEEIPILEHDFERTAALDPTCTKAGYTEGIYCSMCSLAKEAATVLPALGHKFVLKNVKKATESSDGYTGDMVCSVCGEVTQKGQTIPKLAVSTPNKVEKQTIKVAKNLQKTYVVKYKTIKKKAVKLKISAKAKGNISYQVISYPKKAKKQISVSKKGVITLKKGSKKGTYKVKVTAAATKDGKYAKATKTITIKVK